jgi:hypothetical protein
MDASDALDLLEDFFEMDRFSAGAKPLLVKRVDDAKVWKSEGYRSMAHLVAARGGVSMGQAVGMVEMARHLGDFSGTEEAARGGGLSEPQLREIVAASVEDPHAEGSLLERAQEDTYQGLKQEAARVKANAMTAEEERAREERIHRNRHVRGWVDGQGAARGEWQLTAEAAARFWAGLRVEQDRIFKEARAEGRHESHDAYAADALVALAERALGGSGVVCAVPAVTMLVRVDASALSRGTTQGGEVCEIAGVGPIAVEQARAMLPEALLKLVITDGVDVSNVTTIGRNRTAAVQAALDWLHPECGVVGCHQRQYLDYHHKKSFRTTRHTKLSELIPLCKHHHDLVEYRGFTLRERPDGQCDLVPLRDGGERAPP